MSMFREVEEYDEDSDSECEYTTPYTLSAELAELIGQKRVARHSVVKRIGIIIKERRLHDPFDKKFAICDDDFFKVFRTRRFRIAAMLPRFLEQYFLDY